MLNMRAKCPQCKGPTAARGLTCSNCLGGAHGRRRAAVERLAERVMGADGPAPISRPSTIIVERDGVPTEVECGDERVAAVAPIVGFKDDGLGPGNAGSLKPRPELLPADVMIEVCKVLAWGAAKYTRNGQCGDGNWKHVANGSQRYFGASGRHQMLAQLGETADVESGLHPKAHAIVDMMFSYWHDMHPAGESGEKR